MKTLLGLLGVGVAIMIMSVVVASPQEEAAVSVRQTGSGDVEAPKVDCRKTANPQDSWGWIGVRIYDDESRIGPTSIDVVRIGAIYPDTPAERSGLRVNDAIVSVEGIRIYDADQLQRVVRRAGPNSAMRFALLRDGEPWVFEVTTTEWE